MKKSSTIKSPQRILTDEKENVAVAYENGMYTSAYILRRFFSQTFLPGRPDLSSSQHRRSSSSSPLRRSSSRSRRQALPPRHPVIAWCRLLAAALNFGGGTAAAAAPQQEEKRRKEKREKKTQENNKKRRRIAVGCTCIANALHFSASSSLVRAPAHWLYRYSWGKLEQRLQQLHPGLLSSRSIAFDSISRLCIGWSFALVLVLVFFFFFVFVFWPLRVSVLVFVSHGNHDHVAAGRTTAILTIRVM